MRIALLTLEALANARAVRRFVARHRASIVLVGLSDPFRGEAGGMLGQTRRHVRQSGPGILPYLAVNFTLPRIADAFARPRPDEIDRVPLRIACRRDGIACDTVRDVNGPAFRAALVRSGADLLVTFHFDQILSAETIRAAPRGGVNVHPGLLPGQRGPTPTIHALLEEPVALGVSIHRLTARIDAGPLLAQARIPDEPGLSATGAARRLHEAALPLLDEVLADLESGRAAETPIEPGPYQGFPTRDDLRRLAGKGRSLTAPADIRAALGW